MKNAFFIVFLTIFGLSATCFADDGSSQSPTEGNYVILINVFEVPVGKEDETLHLWEQARDYLKNQPGYITTALHQSMMPDARFSLINIARWESVESFKAAIASMRADSGIKPVEGLVSNPALYQVIRRD